MWYSQSIWKYYLTESTVSLESIKMNSCMYFFSWSKKKYCCSFRFWNAVPRMGKYFERDLQVDKVWFPMGNIDAKADYVRRKLSTFLQFFCIKKKNENNIFLYNCLSNNRFHPRQESCVRQLLILGQSACY